MPTTELHLGQEILAMAQQNGQSGGGDMLSAWGPMILIFVAFWFLLIARPDAV